MSSSLVQAFEDILCKTTMQSQHSSIVHIQEVKEKTMGADQNAVTEWAVAKKFEGIAKESTQKLIQKDLLVD